MKLFNAPLTASLCTLSVATLSTAGCGGSTGSTPSLMPSADTGVSLPTVSIPGITAPNGDTPTGVPTGGIGTDPNDTPVSSPVTEPLLVEATEATAQANADTIAVNAALGQTTYLTETEGGRPVTRVEGGYPKIKADRTDTGFVVTVDYGTTPVTTAGARSVACLP